MCAAHNAYLARHDYGWVGREGYRRPRMEDDEAVSVRCAEQHGEGRRPAIGEHLMAGGHPGNLRLNHPGDELRLRLTPTRPSR